MRNKAVDTLRYKIAVLRKCLIQAGSEVIVRSPTQEMSTHATICLQLTVHNG